MTDQFGNTPTPPYYAVIFTSIRSPGDNGYNLMSDEMVRLVSGQDGFLGFESVRDASGFGMTISYWDSVDNIHRWGKNLQHVQTKKTGREKWYSKYQIRICRVESDSLFEMKS